MIMDKIFIDPYNEEFGDFFDLDSGLTSWSKYKMNKTDLEFISSNFISARIKELEMELAYSNDKVGLSKAIIELRKLIN